MTTKSRARPLRTLAAVLGYTLRTAMPARRVLLVLPTFGAVLFGLLSRLGPDGASDHAFAQVAGTALHSLVLPITCLVIGDAILGAEVRSGTFAFTWLSPARYSTIVAGRWLGGWAIAAAVMVPAVVLGATAAGATASIGPSVLAVVGGSAAYLAVFLAVGASFQRPVVWSLGLVVLVERLLGAALAGVAQWSPGWLAQAALVGLTPGADDLVRQGIPHGWAALGRLAVLAGIGLVVAARRLRKLKPASASD
ncbi:MAG: hypothetical protein ACRD0Q_09905 [Acidimicrobiales bacterium]